LRITALSLTGTAIIENSLAMMGDPLTVKRFFPLMFHDAHIRYQLDLVSYCGGVGGKYHVRQSRFWIDALYRRFQHLR